MEVPPWSTNRNATTAVTYAILASFGHEQLQKSPVFVANLRGQLHKSAIFGAFSRFAADKQPNCRGKRGVSCARRGHGD
jgi:hypothetical protein